MVEDARAGRLDLAARAVFAQEGDQVTETRALLWAEFEPQEQEREDPQMLMLRNGANLRRAAESGFVEEG